MIDTDKPKLYTLGDIQNLLANLDNGIAEEECEHSKENEMPVKKREKVVVNGQTRWISGSTIQELCESYVRLLERECIVEKIDPDSAVPTFGDYMDSFYGAFKKKQEQNTMVNRERIIRNHIRPKFGSRPIDRITTLDIQKWFNKLGENYSKETVLKIKNTMSPIFDSAVEDDLITKNPLKSKRLEITGKDTVGHKAIPKAKMKEIREGLAELEPRVRILAALLSYTGMRFEEVLGLKWEDLDDEWILIARAVVHPTRNQPIVKDPKTKTSNRIIPYPKDLKEILEPMRREHGYLLYSEMHPAGRCPLSYTEARRAFEKIRTRFGLDGYSAHDFRDTCATEWREKDIPLDVVARLLGHAKTETTERKYIKYRKDLLLTAVDRI